MSNSKVTPSAVTRIASIGGGPIGAGWAAYFLARGYDVNCYLHDPDEIGAFRDILDTAWISLESLGLSEGASLDRLQISHNLEQALDGVEFIHAAAGAAGATFAVQDAVPTRFADDLVQFALFWRKAIICRFRNQAFYSF